MKENSIEEYVKISLDRYNEFLENNKKVELLDYLYREIRDIVDDNSFNIDRKIDKKIFEIYLKYMKGYVKEHEQK